MKTPAWLSTEARKAWAAALAVLFGQLVAVMAGAGAESVADLTQLQWLTIAVNTFAAFGITYSVPNGEQPGRHAADDEPEG